MRCILLMSLVPQAVAVDFQAFISKVNPQLFFDLVECRQLIFTGIEMQLAK
jgi:hypothetical protein